MKNNRLTNGSVIGAAKVIVDIVPKGHCIPNTKITPTSITIHNTGNNNASAKNNHNYMKNITFDKCYWKAPFSGTHRSDLNFIFMSSETIFENLIINPNCSFVIDNNYFHFFKKSLGGEVHLKNIQIGGFYKSTGSLFFIGGQGSSPNVFVDNFSCIATIDCNGIFALCDCSDTSGYNFRIHIIMTDSFMRC